MGDDRRLEAILRSDAKHVARRNVVQYAAPNLPIRFLQAYQHYITLPLPWRNHAWLQAVTTNAEHIALQPHQCFVSAIPAHIDDIRDTETIFQHASAIAQSGQGCTVILLNASINPNETCDQLFSRCVAAKSALLSAARSKGVFTALRIIIHIFTEKPTIGTVRGLLADSVLVAMADAGIDHPVMISNDIDQLALAPNYIEIVAEHFADPLVDIATGPIYFGYHPDGHTFGGNLQAPELALQSRLLDARRYCLRNRVMISAPYFTTEGPNTAISAAALCRVGGYDYTLSIAEDDLLGTAVYCMRQSPGHCPFPHPAHAHWDEHLWLASDPRRIFKALCADIAMHEAWFYEPFAANDGYQINNAKLTQRYRSIKKYIQPEDIANIDEPACRNKIFTRASALFFGATTMMQILPYEETIYAQRFGLICNAKGIPYALRSSLIATLLCTIKQETYYA